jgi:hypothetical protein
MQMSPCQMDVGRDALGAVQFGISLFRPAQTSSDRAFSFLLSRLVHLPPFLFLNAFR